MKQLCSPLLTCEPVLTEAAYFLREDRLDVDPLFQLIERGALRIALISRVIAAGEISPTLRWW